MPFLRHASRKSSLSRGGSHSPGWTSTPPSWRRRRPGWGASRRVRQGRRRRGPVLTSGRWKPCSRSSPRPTRPTQRSISRPAWSPRTAATWTRYTLSEFSFPFVFAFPVVHYYFVFVFCLVFVLSCIMNMYLRLVESLPSEWARDEDTQLPSVCGQNLSKLFSVLSDHQSRRREKLSE